MADERAEMTEIDLVRQRFADAELGAALREAIQDLEKYRRENPASEALLMLHSLGAWIEEPAVYPVDTDATRRLAALLTRSATQEQEAPR